MEVWESRLYGGMETTRAESIGRFVPEGAEPGQVAGQSNVGGSEGHHCK